VIFEYTYTWSDFVGNIGVAFLAGIASLGMIENS